jgi:arginyl-tRNA synthetase
MRFFGKRPIMDPFKYYYEISAGAAASFSSSARINIAKMVVEPPRNPEHGDVANNLPLIIASQTKRNPLEVGRELVEKFRNDKYVAEASVAPPGFINIRLKPEAYHTVIDDILALGEAYGRAASFAGKNVNVEFVSANPTGPMHVGHCRGAVFGDALANLLENAGAKVTREFYINDAGAQIETLARSAYLRYREALGEEIGEIPPGLYPGDYLKPVGEALAAEHGRKLLQMKEEEWLAVVASKTVAMMMDMIRADLAQLNITHEVFFSERTLHETGAIPQTIEAMRSKGLIYQGRLPPPKGQLPEDWEDREQTLFRATEFGDDIDRPLQKSDGSYTYFAADVAYARDKIERGYDEIVYVLGADHGGYVRRLKAIGRALAGDRVEVSVPLVQLVKLFRGGEPVRMSKRAGEFVTLREVVDEVGVDVVRFMMLYRKNDAPLDFDFVKVTEQSRDNPVFYVQYAHARISSVFRNAAEELGQDVISERALAGADFSSLTDDSELAVIRRLAQFPRLIEAAAGTREPHRVAFYLYDLASDFHSLWNKGKESPHLRFILVDNMQVSSARLALLRAIRYVLSNGLHLLGVRPVEAM